MPPRPPPSPPDEASLPRSVADVVQHSVQLASHRLDLLAFDLRDELRSLLARVALGVVAALFALGALVSLSIALYMALSVWLPRGAAVLVLAGCHLAVVGILVRALRRRPPPLRHGDPNGGGATPS